MYLFGQKSLLKLDSCDFDLQDVAKRALELSPYDFTIIHGWRGEDIQNALYASHASTKQWPDSKHNHMIEAVPNSQALDFAPWIDGDIPWDDESIFAIIAGVFFAAAAELNIKLRYGGDWDSDGSTHDQTLMDWGHVELAE